MGNGIYIIIRRETTDGYVVVPEEYRIEAFVTSKKEALEAVSLLNKAEGLAVDDNGLPINSDDNFDDDSVWYDYERVEPLSSADHMMEKIRKARDAKTSTKA